MVQYWKWQQWFFFSCHVLLPGEISRILLPVSLQALLLFRSVCWKKFTIRLYDKSSSACPDGSTESSRWEIPNSTLSQLLPGPSKAHQPIKGASPQDQRSTEAQRQMGTQIPKGRQELRRDPLCRPFQGCPRTPSDPVSMPETHQDEWILEPPFGLRGVAA